MAVDIAIYFLLYTIVIITSHLAVANCLFLQPTFFLEDRYIEDGLALSYSVLNMHFFKNTSRGLDFFESFFLH